MNTAIWDGIMIASTTTVVIFSIITIRNLRRIAKANKEIAKAIQKLGDIEADRRGDVDRLRPTDTGG